MKKILAVLLAVVLLASLTACGDNEGALIGGVNNTNNDVDATFKTEFGTLTYEYVESDTIRIIGYSGKIELHDVKIDAVINELTVVEIGEGAFYELSNVKAVTIPDSVKVIGKNAFAGCRELVSVNLPASLTTLGENAFYQCEKLETVTFTNTEAAALTVVSKAAFRGCVALKNITLPATVKTIGVGAFSNCTALVDFVMPAALEGVGAQAFQGCTKLATVAFSDQITVCDAYAFEGCESLTSVTCPVLDGWTAVLNEGTADEEKVAITFDSSEAAIDILTRTHFNYKLVRSAS